MTVILKMGVHHNTGGPVVEVWDNAGRFVAAIYPDDEANGIKIVSKYLLESCEVILEDHPAAPALVVPFPRAS